MLHSTAGLRFGKQNISKMFHYEILENFDTTHATVPNIVGVIRSIISMFFFSIIHFENYFIFTEAD